MFSVVMDAQQMPMFKQGDRIWSIINGRREEATVDRVSDDRLHRGRTVVWAYWDSDQKQGKDRVGPYYTDIESCYHIELQYDPTQQGDRDEDI